MSQTIMKKDQITTCGVPAVSRDDRRKGGAVGTSIEHLACITCGICSAWMVVIPRDVVREGDEGMVSLSPPHHNSGLDASFGNLIAALTCGIQ
uniref:Uncharacterized protein n=1 Tax=Arundo donax TaxID=35708 RepID=A0A0A8YAW7_ARUDO